MFAFGAADSFGQTGKLPDIPRLIGAGYNRVSVAVRENGYYRVPRQPTAKCIKEGGMIQSQVDGEFNGWEGETLIKLVNGQVWQQTEYWYHYHYAYMPKVTITTDGGYKMQVAGVPRAVRVERLK